MGVDIGRRAVRIAVADPEGSIVARLDEPNRCRSACALVRTVSESVEHAVSSAGLRPHEVAAARSRRLTKARSAKDVFSLGRAGDERALRVVEEEAEKLAYVVAAVTAVLDPRLIVLGGGIGGNTDLLAAPMRRGLRRAAGDA